MHHHKAQNGKEITIIIKTPREKPSSCFVGPMGCSRAEGRCLYSILLQLCLHMHIKLLRDRRNEKTFISSLLLRILLWARERKIFVYQIWGDQWVLLGAVFYFHVCGSSNLSRESIHVHWSVQVCVFFGGTVEFNCLSLADRISYFRLRLHPLWPPPPPSSLSLTHCLFLLFLWAVLFFLSLNFHLFTVPLISWKLKPIVNEEIRRNVE